MTELRAVPSLPAPPAADLDTPEPESIGPSLHNSQVGTASTIIQTGPVHGEIRITIGSRHPHRE